MASVDLTIKFRKKKEKKKEKSFLINKKNNTGLASLQLVFTKQGYNMYIERTAITESTTINSPTLLTSRLGRSLCRSIYVYLRKLRLRLFFFFWIHVRAKYVQLSTNPRLQDIHPPSFSQIAPGIPLRRQV